MAAYRRKQIVLQAVQWRPGVAVAGLREVAAIDVCGTRWPAYGVLTHAGRGVLVHPEQWIVWGAAGEVWCVEKETFALYYEPADDGRFGGYEGKGSQ